MKSVSGIKAGENTRTYVSQASYDSGGGLDGALLGNGRWEDRDYNERKQLVSIKLGSTQGAGDLLALTFGYGTTNNNGNVLSQTIVRPGFSATQTYEYDAYNRIRKVTEGTNFRDFRYAEPGNLYVPSWSRGAGWARGSFTPTSPAWFNANNQLVNAQLGIGYDAAGNMTAIGGFTFTYDAENRLASSTLNGVTTTYTYDGEGRRVKKGSVVMVYDAFGRLAAEYGGTADPVGTEYLTADHLGSTRLITSATGAERRCLDYLPFGEQMPQGMGTRGACYASANEPRVKFTGKERDQETGLDYFIARYYSDAQGRFTSPDEPLLDQDPVNPQSWNLYAYGWNNPLSFVDPTGQYVCASSVSKEECVNFQKSLDQAQTAANKLKEKYGAASAQYTSAQRAIDAYGKAGVDNGVAIKIGNTGKCGAQIDVAGTTVAKTADNPTGQNIAVTFNTGMLSGTELRPTLVAHEGQHVADASSWVGSGFSSTMNPSSYQTDFNAYQVQAAVGEGMGWLYQTVSFGGSPYLLWVRGWPQNNTDTITNIILRQEYNLTPSSTRRAFSRASRVRQ